MIEKLYHRPLEDKEELVSKRKESFSKGYPTGFRCLDELASFKPNYQSLIFAPPHVGKSVITLDILMAQAEMGRKSCIYSPEFRDRKELTNALVQARLKKCFFGKYADSITDEEYIEALQFVNENFVLITKPRRKKDNSQTRMTIKQIFAEVKKASDDYNMKFDFLFLDPINYVEKGSDEKFLETQEYVLGMYDQVAEYSELLGIHTMLSAHTRDVELITDKDTGVSYYPVIHPSAVMGGQSNFRSAYLILHYHRAPEGVVNKLTGVPYPADYTVIYTQKAKPFGIGKIGNTGALSGMEGLYFDKDTYTMFEIVQGKKYYRNEWYNEQNPTKSDSAIKPNKDFYRSSKMNDLDHLSNDSIF